MNYHYVLINIFLILRPYNKVMDFRTEFCTPHPIKDCLITENELRAPMEKVLHHDLTKLFQLKPNLKKEIDEIKEQHPQAEFDLVFKYGNTYHIRFIILQCYLPIHDLLIHYPRRFTILYLCILKNFQFTEL